MKQVRRTIWFIAATAIRTTMFHRSRHRQNRDSTYWQYHLRMPNAGHLAQDGDWCGRNPAVLSGCGTVCGNRWWRGRFERARKGFSQTRYRVFEPVSGMAEWKDKVVKQQRSRVLVLFGAERCVHCKALHPVWKKPCRRSLRTASWFAMDVDASETIVATAMYRKSLLWRCIATMKIPGNAFHGNMITMMSVTFWMRCSPDSA